MKNLIQKIDNNIFNPDVFKEIYDIFTGDNLRKIDILFEYCKVLKDEKAKIFNDEHIKYLDDKNVSLRNLIKEILQFTIKYSPELIEKYYREDDYDFNRNLIDVTIYTNNDVIKKFLLKIIEKEKTSTVRSSIYESLINYTDDPEVLNMFISRYDKEDDLQLLIIQQISNFDYVLSENFLFNLLIKAVNPHQVLIILYSLSKISHQQRTFNFLINNFLNYNEILHPYFLKCIVKIADNNKIDLHRIDINSRNNLIKVSDLLLNIDEKENENIYIYLRINENRLNLLDKKILLNVLNSLNSKNIHFLINQLIRTLNTSLLEELFIEYFKDVKDINKILTILEIILTMFNSDKLIIKNLRYFIEKGIIKTDYKYNPAVIELLSMFN